MRATFYVLVGGFTIGVAVRSITEVSIYTVSAILVVLLFISILWQAGVCGKRVLYAVLFGLVFLIGVFRTEYAHYIYEQGNVLHEGERVQTTGSVIAEADERDTHVVLKVLLPETGTVLRVKAPSYTAFQYGDDVSVSGVVREPEAFETENGRVFNYPGYLMKEHVHYELREAEITRRGTNSGNVVTRVLLDIKHRWLASIASLLPEPAASLAGGLVVGAKQSLGERWLALFRDTGIIHIVVLSGYNLTLIANAIVRATAKLPEQIRFLLGTVGIASFAVMVGGGATVVRASIMAFLGMLAGFIRRRYVLLRALVLAAFVMVAWNPFVLLFDVGFQLSFIATAGLLVFAPYLETFFHRIPRICELRAIVAATIATQLAVLPLLLFHIGTISLIAPLVNILVLPVVPAIMAFGFVSGLIGVVSQVVALPVAYLTHILLSYIFTVVKTLSAVPYAAVALPALPWWSVVFVYLLAAGVLIWQYKKPLTVM